MQAQVPTRVQTQPAVKMSMSYLMIAAFQLLPVLAQELVFWFNLCLIMLQPRVPKQGSAKAYQVVCEAPSALYSLPILFPASFPNGTRITTTPLYNTHTEQPKRCAKNKKRMCNPAVKSQQPQIVLTRRLSSTFPPLFIVEMMFSKLRRPPQHTTIPTCQRYNSPTFSFNVECF